MCPNCGSRSVKTDKSRDFRPSGAIAPSAVGQTPQPHQPPTTAPLASQSVPPTAQPVPATPSGPSIWQQLGKFHARHWRIIWAVVFAVAPFGSLGDETTYTGSTAANVLEFVGILVGCWVVAAVFLTLHLRHRAARQ